MVASGGEVRVVDALAEVWGSLLEVGRGVADAQWDLPTRCPGWRVRDQFSHVIGVESALAGRPQPEVEVPEAEYLRNDIGRFNEAWIEERRGRTGEQVLAEFDAITSERLDALRRMTPDQFDEEAWTPAGHATYGRFMQIRVFDCWMHLQDVRAALGRPGDLDGVAVDVALDEMGLALGYVVGKKAGARLGQSVAIVVDGPQRRRFDLVVEARARLVDGPALRPTATVTTDLATFAALVGGRTGAVAALEDGRVEFAGDGDLARRVAANLAFVV